MRRWFASLPGPTTLKVIVAVIVVAVAVVALFFFYDWIGKAFLDTGGTIG